METNNRLFLITMGDPAGIGPEIILKSFLNPSIQKIPCMVVGSYKLLQSTCKKMGLPWTLQKVSHIEEIPRFPQEPNHIVVWDVDNVEMDHYQPGIISGEYGQAAYQYLKTAVDLASQFAQCSAIITAPIHKGALKLAQIAEPGHTEILQNLTGVAEVMTMFVVEKLRVFFYTRHLSLRKALEALDIQAIVQYLKNMDSYLRQIGIQQPCLALAALNPHASDHGLFGDEEKNILEPAVEMAKHNRIHVVGPVPADSVFHQGLQGKYTAILSLYHDQGHIACKTYNFERTISMTLGLPFLRTSVDHGTAFDIAGQWIASSVSMEEAIFQAVAHSK